MLAKELSREKARIYVQKILQIFNVSTVSRVVLEDALKNGFKDYEYGVLYQSAIHANLETIITRNQKDFTKSSLPVYSPDDFLDALDVLE